MPLDDYISAMKANSLDNGEVKIADVNLTQSVSDTSNIEWMDARGDWSAENHSIIGSSDLDSRRISKQSFPQNLDILVEISLFEGNGAGILVWTSMDGETGYGVRIDRQLNALVLFRLGPWPNEERLDTFPLEAGYYTPTKLRVVTATNGIRVYDDSSIYPILETLNPTIGGDRIGLYLLDGKASYHLKTILTNDSLIPSAHIPKGGEYAHLFDQSVGEKETWYINDHCVVRDLNGLWHLFGITHPAPANPMEEDQFAHASSESFLTSPWTKHPFALETDPNAGEDHLWAPHVIEKDGVYYMFYCAGSHDGHYRYRIHLATSTDMFHWKRYEDNPLFEDYFDARDPMVLKTADGYIMYYTATLERPEGKHIVAYRTSDDLLHWSPRKVAFAHPTSGTFAGPTESPFVVSYGDHFYLFIGPDSDYRTTTIYRSANPYHWDLNDRASSVNSHAAEVVQDKNGDWFVTHCGWYFNGLYAAPLSWNAEPTVRLFHNVGESVSYLTEHHKARASDWLESDQLDFVADFDAYFTFEFPISNEIDSLQMEYEEMGETRIEALVGNGSVVLFDEGNGGPGYPTVQSITVNAEAFRDGVLRVRFSDSDPTDGWGPNVNWIRLLW